jgi:hypothetical protein
MNASALIDALLRSERLVAHLAVDPYGTPAIYQILSPDAETFPRAAVFEDDREYTRFADDVPLEERVRFRIDLYARESYLDEAGVYVKSATYEILEQLPLPWEE